MRRPPHEEKALSYTRDCRYSYGNNSKAARKPVRRKRIANKANRHADQQFLAEARGPIDADRAEDVGQRLAGRRPKHWRKRPDMPLGRVLERRRQRGEH